mgnify:CR=1 FL=1
MINAGSIVGLYPTPDTVVGTVQNGKPHYTAKALHVGANLSVNLVDEAMLVKADYVGIVSGKTVDKSDVFPIFHGQLPDALSENGKNRL